jgi:hypothetical protein
MTETTGGHRDRIVEKLVGARLRTHGGVLLTGPKAVGKTTHIGLWSQYRPRRSSSKPSLKVTTTSSGCVTSTKAGAGVHGCASRHARF